MDKIYEFIKKVFRKADPLKINPAVAQNAYLKQADQVRQVDETDIASAANLLESTLVMADDLPEDAPIALSLTKKELNSFVCYMRELDGAYREQGKFIARHITIRNPGELKAIEEAAEVSPQRYAELTGQGSR